ncbi:MAG: HpaII family restriction endonuclease, partial [Bacteroidales bacterium]|nr:HpaII family restriction endonuclease [Bacteroidales bacterium]
NRNLFEDYLLNNTDFTTPGKHEQNNFGIVYKQNNHYYMNLELQVRFLQ